MAFSRGSFTVQLEGILTNAGDLSTPRSTVNVSQAQELASGTGANQADGVWSDLISVGAGSSSDINLIGGLTDPFGNAIAAMAEIAAIYVRNQDTLTAIEVGGAVSNAVASLFGNTSDTLVIPPGGLALLAAPGASAYSITSSTDVLRITRAAGSPTDTDVEVGIIFRTS
ncbi:MAG: hypothetical protein AAF432_00430 [Planctomycetota bacterium]